MKIPIFDIDWTLLKGGNRAHELAFKYAFKTVYGVNASIYEVEHQGRIDSQIILMILARHNYSSRKAKDKLPQAYTAMMDYFIKHENQGIYKTMPGVPKLLKLLKEKGFIIGILTGNLKGIALTKLKKANVSEFVDFGIFGNMAFKRADLVPLALKKAALICHKEINFDDLVIIGDSLHDVKCAKDNNSHCIAVTTGPNSKKELQDAGAELVLSSLNQSNKIINYLQR